MTNEEKIKEIASDSQNLAICANDTPQFALTFGALQMANWKDQQFKEYLENKTNEVKQYKKNSIGLFPTEVIRYNGAIAIINEIINELFNNE